MNTSHPEVRTVSTSPWTVADKHVAADAPRLIVVVSAISEEAALAARILAQTRTASQPVLLLGIAATREAENDLRRSLATVQAFIAAQGHPVDLKSEAGKGWLERIRPEFHPTDQVACYEEEGASLWNEPLSDVLARALEAPICDFSALHNSPAGGRPILMRAGAWLGSLGVIGGFLALQARVVISTQGWVQSLVLIVTFMVEMGLILLWNSFLG